MSKYKIDAMLLCFLLFVLTVLGTSFSPTTRKIRDASSHLSRNMFSGIVEEIGSVNTLVKDAVVQMWDG